MLLVLDFNEYIGGLGSLTSPASIRLFKYLTSTQVEHRIFASRTILDEVRRNLPPARFSTVWDMLVVLDVSIVEEWEIPDHLHAKFIAMGFKPGDAAIAACAEASGAEAVVTENRDFHGREGLPFRPLRAEEFLKEHETAK